MLSTSADETLDALARLLVRHHLVTPALVLLDGVRPLGRAVPVCMTAALPVLELVAPRSILAALRDALDEPGGLERLRARILAASGS